MHYQPKLFQAHPHCIVIVLFLLLVVVVVMVMVELLFRNLLMTMWCVMFLWLLQSC